MMKNETKTTRRHRGYIIEIEKTRTDGYVCEIKYQDGTVMVELSGYDNPDQILAEALRQINL